MKARLTKEEFKKKSENFRIEAIISDGMWLSQPKWRKLSGVSQEALEEWISSNLPFGVIEQAPTGAKSYRMPYQSIIEWYRKQGFTPGEQLLEHIFPARIWDNMTEVEGFLEAPLREIGMVTFTSDRKDVTDRVKEALVGIGGIRESEAGVYRVYALSASSARKHIEPILREAYGKETKIYSRNSSNRRELKDFSEEFGYKLVSFYRKFAKSLVKGSQETINIFIDDNEDQDSQLTLWVIAAIEKFDEKAAVPFSGYLNHVINRWVYDLPDEALGKELSSFQRKKARAVKDLRVTRARAGGDHNREFSNEEISEIMGIDKKKFFDLDSRNRIWTRMKSSVSLTWDETSEEKQSISIADSIVPKREDNDIDLANQISFAVVGSAIDTGRFDDAFSLITQIGMDEMDITRLNGLSPEFIREFGSHMGIRG